MSHDPSYASDFRHLAMARDEAGVLQVRMHTNGGPLVWTLDVYKDMVHGLTAIGADPGNRVIVLTGTGDTWAASADLGDPATNFTPDGFDQFAWHGRRLAQRLLEIEAPMIAAVNGPVLIHTEVPLLCDIVLAGSNARFSDTGHLPGGIAASDGAHIIWPELLGEVRGRTFLWLNQSLDAGEMLAFGAVSEVLPPDRLLPRAREIAAGLAKLPSLTLRHTRVALTQRMRRRFAEGIDVGFALEGATVTAAMLRMSAEGERR